MSKPFKMRGPTFFKSAIKSYSPTKQAPGLGTQLNEAGSENTNFGGAIAGNQPSTTEPVGPTQDEAAMTAQTLAEKREASGGRKYQPGGGPGQSPATMKSPAKQHGPANPDNTVKVGAGGQNEAYVLEGMEKSPNPKKSPNKQKQAKQELGAAGNAATNKAEMKAKRAQGPLEMKSPAKQGPTPDEIKTKYGSYKDYKKAVKKGHVKKGSLGETS